MAQTTDQGSLSSPGHLDEEGRAILSRQLEGLPDDIRKKASPMKYAARLDVAVLVASSIMGILAGAANPLLTVIFGQLAGTFADFARGDVTSEELRHKSSQFTLYYIYLAVAEFVLIYGSTVGFYYAGERVTQRIRHAYLDATVRQNMAYFDTQGVGIVTNHIASDMNQIQESLTSKLPLALTAAANFGSAFVIAFIMSWKLALVLCSVFAAMFIVTYVTTPYAIKYGIMSSRLYGDGSSIAQEALSSIRDVTASGSQDQLCQKYEETLAKAEKAGLRSRLVVALSIGWFNAMPCFAEALGFFAGTRFLIGGHSNVSSLVSAIIAVVNGAFAVVRIVPTAQAFVSGMASASAVFEIIARQSPQDPKSQKGIKPEKDLVGEFKLKNLELVYPSRQEVLVLRGVDIDIPAFKTTAIVGLSGSGKSSIFGLLERFYEPTKGSITVDGHDLQELNLRWLRNQMGYVGQEPVLFSATVFENIRLGLEGCGQTYDAATTREKVIAAAKLANAHDFIMSLASGYETEVGEKGALLSGGQRQRVAIARAVISEPKILLLDEATSALDTTSERKVQLALDAAARDRTTIVITHRLSTIKSADKIIVMGGGKVLEEGSHQELMALKGTYLKLVETQQVDTGKGRPPSIFESDSIHGSIGQTKEKYSVSADSREETGFSGLRDEENLGRNSKPKAGLISTLKLMVEINRRESLFLVGGMVSAMLAGLGLPAQSIPFAKILSSFKISPTEEPHRLQHDVSFWALIFTVIGIYCFLIWVINGVLFAYATEKLASRARHLCLKYLLRQDIGYFDDEEHSTDKASAMLASCGSDLAGFGGAVIGSILTFTFTIVSGIIMSLAFGWKLALVCMVTIPFTALLGWVRLQFTSIFETKVRLSGQQAAAYATEAVKAIRTVAADGLEDFVLERYQLVQKEQASESLPTVLKVSALFAASQSVPFLAAALAFWYGSRLLASHEYGLTQYFICFITLIWGSAIAGALFNFAPDVGKAMNAAMQLRAVFDRTPTVDNWDSTGARVKKSNCRGHISLQNVNFRYPARPDQLVLRNCTIDIPEGKFVALVGASGSGKSTILSLLERFYKPASGMIALDGQDISSINIKDYRGLLSLVGQDPAIYSGTVRDNLLLGHSNTIPEDVLVRVCKDANIYDFISSLP